MQFLGFVLTTSCTELDWIRLQLKLLLYSIVEAQNFRCFHGFVANRKLAKCFVHWIFPQICISRFDVAVDRYLEII